MNTNNNQISIREFKPEDAHEVAKIKTDAFGGKIGKLLKNKREKLERMFYTTLNKDRSNGIFVAENNREVIGYIKLLSRDTMVSRPSFNILSFVRKFGLLDSVKFLTGFFIIESNNLKKGEGYVSQLAVSSKGRGKGIGTLLLKAGESLFRKSKRLKNYTLFVMEENRGAHKLYSRFGFKEKSRIKIPLMKAVIGYTSAIYMVKEL